MLRAYKAGLDYGQIELIFHQRLQEPSVRISRAFKDGVRQRQVQKKTLVACDPPQSANGPEQRTR
jgi:hypothetical protein